MRGRCLCGDIKFEISEPIHACVHCHCDSCRRQCSAPMTTYVGVPDTQWRWISDKPKVFHSSPGVERTFCGQCGTPLSFRSAKMSKMMHFYVTALENPAKFTPTLHVSYEKLPWINLNDGLPTCVGPDYTKK